MKKIDDKLKRFTPKSDYKVQSGIKYENYYAI